MELYFSPLACSLASRVALYEAKADARFIEVDSKTKHTTDGADYLSIYPLGMVPLIRLDDGSILTENAAILQYIATRYPEAQLGARDDFERAKLQQWLCFIGTELHKALFSPLLSKALGEETKQHALEKGKSRLAYLNHYLMDHEFLLARFTVADAYLYTVLNWSMATAVDLASWPAVQSYYKSMQERPSVAKAFNEELALYKAEHARHQTAA